MAAETRKNVFIALRMAGVAGRGKLDGILHYVDSNKLNWNIQLVRTSLELTRETVSDALSRRTDGFILSMPGSEDAVRPLLDARVPLVVLDTQDADRATRRCNLAIIANDSHAIGEAAARHLMSQGAFATFGYVSNDSTRWAKDRGMAFSAMLERHGHHCVNFAAALNGTVVPDRSGLARWLAWLPKPAALFVDCDDHAHSVLDVCLESGIDVPNSVAVLGVGNDEVICAHSTPMLSSILPDFKGEGLLAARLLRGMMATPSAKAKARFFLRNATETIVRESSSPNSSAHHLVLRAMKFIRENRHSRIGVDDVVRHLKVSRSLANLRFREVEGASLFATIRRIRLEGVCELLATTRSPIEEITHTCGFDNVNHLKNIFKRAYGMSMRDYRDRPPLSAIS